MKKIIVPVIALLLVSLLVACTGQGGENTYTGDYKEYSNSSSVPSDMANTSGSDTDSSTVTVPLTTQAGATVPPVTTTQPTTAFSTVDYTPITPDTTKPVVNTTYYNDPSNTTNSYLPTSSGGDNTSPVTGNTASELKYVGVSNYDTDFLSRGTVGGNDFVLVLSVTAEKLKGDPIASSGTATLNISGTQKKARYKVLDSRGPDDDIVVEISASNLSIIEDDEITVTMPKGAIKTKENITNKKFTSAPWMQRLD